MVWEIATNTFVGPLKATLIVTPDFKKNGILSFGHILTTLNF